MNENTVQQKFDRYLARQLLLEASRQTDGSFRNESVRAPATSRPPDDPAPQPAPQPRPQRPDSLLAPQRQESQQGPGNNLGVPHAYRERLLTILRQQQARRLLGSRADRLAPRAEPEADIAEGDLDQEGEEKAKQCACLRALKRSARKFYSLVKSEVGMVLILVGYAALGAWIFSSIEGPHETKMLLSLDIARRNYVKKVLEATGRKDELFWFIECENYLQNETLSDLWNDTMFLTPHKSVGSLDNGTLEENQTSEVTIEWTHCGAMVNRLAVVVDKYFEEMLETKLYGQLNRGAMTWNYWGAMFYCGTIFTTVGYGNIVTQTDEGRIATMIYALIGIPLCLVVFGKIGSSLTRLIKFFWAYVRRFYYTGSCRKVRRLIPQSKLKLSFVQRIRRRMTSRGRKKKDKKSEGGGGEDIVIVAAEVEDVYVPTEIDENFNLPPIVAILIAFGYILLGATIYKSWEAKWDWLLAFYFTFISLSTVGLGDVIPEHPKFFMATSAYLLIGFALIAMVINVVMESVRSTIDLAREQLLALGHNIIPIDLGLFSDPNTPLVECNAEKLHGEAKGSQRHRRCSV